VTGIVSARLSRPWAHAYAPRGLPGDIEQKRGKTKSRLGTVGVGGGWGGGGEGMQGDAREREKSIVMCFSKKERGAWKCVAAGYSISSRDPQLVPRESSPQDVVCAGVCTRHTTTLPLFSLSLSPPPPYIAFYRQHNKVLAIRSWLSRDTET